MTDIFASPLYFPLRQWLVDLPSSPDVGAIAALAEAHPRFANGRRIRFAPPCADGLAYESRIWAQGMVETRPDNWHDWFNALVWLSFPQTKVAISARHVQAMQAPGALRGQERDALTHFDECGVLVLSSNPLLLDLLRNFEWKALFVTHRAEVERDMRFVVFGHATYEALLQPFRGLTAKALLLPVEADWLCQAPDADWIVAVDRLLAAKIEQGEPDSPQALQPLPLLGIPGVVPENEDPAYYDDTWQFRPGRRSTKKAA